MGPPVFARARIPVLASTPGDTAAEAPARELLEVDGTEFDISAVSMGNPHCVVFVSADPSQVPVEHYGPVLVAHRRFPRGTNVEFVKVMQNGEILQRTHERGSGETLACGSGACAAVVAAIRRGILEQDRWHRVRLRGGELEVNWERSGAVIMRGPAREVFRGNWNLEAEPERPA
jgi:diaminopimelate epimerase